MAFNFTTLTGTETAGWNSINALITDIDNKLTASTRLIYMSGTPTSGYTITWDGVKWVAGQLGAAGIANDAVALGTKTTGDYVASVSAAGTNEISVTGSGEGAAATVRLANNTALRGAATVETPPTYSNGSTGTVGRIADAKYVTDALAYATAGNITLTGDVTVTGGAATIATGAVTSNKILDGTIVNGDINASAAIAYSKLNLNNSIITGDITQDAITYDKLNDDAKVYAPVSITSTPTTLAIGTHDSTKNTTIPLVRVDNSTSNYVINIPTGGVIGSTISIFQTGSGTVTVQPVSSSVTINGSTSNTYVLGAAYSMVTLVCYASNTWIITGDYY